MRAIRRGGRGYVLPHDGRETAKLKHVSGDEEQCVEQLFLLARVAASREEDEENGDDAECGHDQVHDIPKGLPKLL